MKVFSKKVNWSFWLQKLSWLSLLCSAEILTSWLGLLGSADWRRKRSQKLIPSWPGGLKKKPARTHTACQILTPCFFSQIKYCEDRKNWTESEIKFHVCDVTHFCAVRKLGISEMKRLLIPRLFVQCPLLQENKYLLSQNFVRRFNLILKSKFLHVNIHFEENKCSFQ